MARLWHRWPFTSDGQRIIRKYWLFQGALIALRRSWAVLGRSRLLSASSHVCWQSSVGYGPGPEPPMLFHSLCSTEEWLNCWAYTRQLTPLLTPFSLVASLPPHGKHAFVLFLWNPAQPSHPVSCSEPQSNITHTLFCSTFLCRSRLLALSCCQSHPLTAPWGNLPHNAWHIIMSRDSSWNGCDVNFNSSCSVKYTIPCLLRLSFCCCFLVLFFVFFFFFGHTARLAGS